jgi:DNA-binding NtrC family response regulator
MSHELRKIGLVEDDPIMGEPLVQRLSLEGFQTIWWTDGTAALEAASAGLGLVICDIRLPDIDGEQVFRQLAKTTDPPPFFFITGHADIDQAVRLIRAGGADFITKPFAMDDFLTRVGAVYRAPRVADGGPVLGASQIMRSVEDTLRRLADHALPLLLTGETGVGKEVAARFLHGVSRRASAPFMAVNCAAIPADLLESEIFGHERGAFTGANARHVGYAERAKSGILFLDEIGDMPLPLQAKLLRLLEDGSFLRLGGETPVRFSARVLAASNHDLSALIAAERFRPDLLFRLNGLSVELPPLRHRPDDILWLAERLYPADEANERGIRGLSTLAEEAALAHAWPGNVRELRNRLQRAVALGTGEWIMPADLFPELGEQTTAEGIFATLSEVRDAAERRQISRALGATDGQIEKSARMLGISRTTLWEKMRRLGIDNASSRSES